MTELERKTLEAIKDLCNMFGDDCNTIASSTLFNNCDDYDLDAKQVRANIVTLEKKGIVGLEVFYGEQCIYLK